MTDTPEFSDPTQRQDDPETQAFLDARAHDPKWQQLQKRIDEHYGVMRDYRVDIITPMGIGEAPVFATSDERALQTFDQMVMLWHSNRRLYPTSLFDFTACPDATELVLRNESGEELSRFILDRSTGLN